MSEYMCEGMLEDVGGLLAKIEHRRIKIKDLNWRNLQQEKRIKELEAQLEWLDNNTTHYETHMGNVPVLASVSKKIWYHATDDVDSYPFSAVIKQALEKDDG